MPGADLNGERHLFAALDLMTDKMYGHIKTFEPLPEGSIPSNGVVKHRSQLLDHDVERSYIVANPSERNRPFE